MPQKPLGVLGVSGRRIEEVPAQGSNTQSRQAKAHSNHLLLSIQQKNNNNNNSRNIQLIYEFMHLFSRPFSVIQIASQVLVLVLFLVLVIVVCVRVCVLKCLSSLSRVCVSV